MPKVSLWKYGVPKGTRSASRMPSSLPEWAEDPSLYKGTFIAPGVNPLTLKVAPGRVTVGFAQALFHAIMVLGGVSYNDSVADAFGSNDGYCMAQYVNSVDFASVSGSDTIRLEGLRVTLKPTATEVISGVYDKNNKKFFMHNHLTSQNVTNDAAMLFTMWPIFMQDDTFGKEMQWFLDERNGHPDNGAIVYPSEVELKVHLLAISNAAQHVTEDMPTEFTVNDISQNLLANPRYKATFGYGPKGFSFLPVPDNMARNNKGGHVNVATFAGKYDLGQTLSPEQEADVPVLDEKVVVPTLADTICKMVHTTTGKARTVRNIFLFGPTGTGKSKLAQIVAAGLHVPYAALNCNPDTSNIDLLVSCMPADGGDKLDLRNYKGLPTIEDMQWSPDDAWYTMTGERNEKATFEECLNLAFESVTGRKQPGVTVVEYATAVAESAVADAEARTGQRYIYVQSPLVRAMIEGGVVELQELNTIVQGGVLAGLNSVLDENGSAFLPQGKTVHRHPNCIVIATANVTYVGCRQLNQSFLRRFQFKAFVPNPPKDQMIERVKAMVGFSANDFVDDRSLDSMVETMMQVKQFCKENDLTDGDIGVCEVADWVNTANVLHSIRDAANYTIIPSATQNEDDSAEVAKIIEARFL